MISINNTMKKSFDQLFSEIVGETLMAPTQLNQPQQNQPVPAANQQTDELPDEIAKLFVAAKTPQEVNAAYVKLQQMKQQTPQPNQQQQNQQQQNAANKPA